MGDVFFIVYTSKSKNQIAPMDIFAFNIAIKG